MLRYMLVCSLGLVLATGVSTRWAPSTALVLLSPLLFITAYVLFAAFDVWLTYNITSNQFHAARAQEEELAQKPLTSLTTALYHGSTAACYRSKVPPLVFTSPAAWSVTQTRASWESSTVTRTPFRGASPALSAAVDSLFDLILRDFVWKWYSSISDSPVFPNAVESTIRDALASITRRVSDVDWSDLTVGKILPIVTAHVDRFREAELALRGQGTASARGNESDEFDLFVAAQYAKQTPQSKLHDAVDIASPNSKPSEEAWLSRLVDHVLPCILPEREADSAAVRIIVREIVACAVLFPIIEMLSDPDFWNRIIDEKAGAAIRDQKMVTQFREALDKQGSSLKVAAIPVVPPSTPAATTRPKRTEEISVRTSTKQFESWVRAISKSNNLLDVRRLRSDVTAQIRKTKALVEERKDDKGSDSVTRRELLAHIERLYIAKRAAEKRIAELGGMPSSSRDSVLGDGRALGRSKRLRDILLQPTSLSYFMEFQERRGRAVYLQFWLLVEGLKDPLVDDSTELDRLDETRANLIAAQSREDLQMIRDAYIKTNAVRFDPRHTAAIRSFLELDAAGTALPRDVRRARQAVLAAQQSVLAEMEEDDYPEFAQTDLYFKALADFPRQQTSDQVDIFALTSALETRPRSSSDPSQHRTATGTSYQQRSTHAHVAPTPPVLPSVPLSKAVHLQRKDTAPPQVTLEAAFDQYRPANVRSGSAGIISQPVPGRKISSGSLDSSLMMQPTRPALSDSLDFLMASPVVEQQERARSPLFVEDQNDIDRVQLSPRQATCATDDDYVQVETIEAIQEALTTILASNARSGLGGGGSTTKERPLGSMSPMMERSRTLSPTPESPFSTASDLPVLPRVVSGSSTGSGSGPGSRRKVFDDDEDMDDIAGSGDESDAEIDPRSIRIAAPGDLQLPAEIARLAAAIDKLSGQEAVVGAMIRKAELTGRASELKILIKSRDSLRRELRALSFQKGQYELQESENKLTPGRTIINISGTTVGQAGGQNFQLYLVEVRPSSDTASGSGWLVTKRYSEFATLQADLKDSYPVVRQFDFPGKRLVTSYNQQFIEQRRLGLERWLRQLVRDPAICQSSELRAFLSQQNISLPQLEPEASKRGASILLPGQGLVKSIYKTLASGFDEVLGAGPATIMDTVIQRLSQQAAEISKTGGAGIQDEDLVGKIFADGATGVTTGIDGTGDTKMTCTETPAHSTDEGLTYFTAPICDLFVTLFSLKEKNNWLRRQAILIILQQVLGGTIERKFRDGVKILFGSDQLVGYISALKNGLWPNGQPKPKERPRTMAEKVATRDSAHRKLLALMPDVAANLIGRSNARQGARQLFAVLQNRRLNRHLIYSILDEVFAGLFPDVMSGARGASLSSFPSRSYRA